jgi:hypothetical protein
MEKKKTLKRIIETLPDDKLDEAILVVEDLAQKDEKRIDFVKELLQKEKALFEKLAQ